MKITFINRFKSQVKRNIPREGYVRILKYVRRLSLSGYKLTHLSISGNDVYDYCFSGKTIAKIPFQ
jgi:hypothetical protein